MSSSQSNGADSIRVVSPPNSQAWVAPSEVAATPRVRSSGDHEPVARRAPSGPQPALHDAPVARLAPRSIRQLLDGGFEVVRYRFSTVAALAAVLVVPFVSMPTVLAAFWIHRRSGTDPFATPGATPFGALGESGWLAVWGWAAGSLAHTLLAVALSYLVSSWLVGVDPGVRDGLRFVMGRLPVIFAAWLFVSVTKLLALCGLGLPLLPFWALLGPVIGAERTSVGDSLRRTATLGRRTYGRLVLLSMSFAVVSYLVRIATWWAPVYLGPLLGLSEPVSAVLVTVLQVAASVVLVALLAGTMCLAYLDARSRTEGLDIELAAAEVFGRAGR